MNKRVGSHVGPFMTKTILFLLTLFLTLTGCTYETNEQEEDMGRPHSIPEQWGQEKVFKPGTWKAGQVRVVLTRDTPAVFVPPQTSTIIAGIVNGDADESQRYILRWVLRPGTGGARTEVRFDATGFTRVALPLEAFSLGIECEPFDDVDPDFPAGIVQAFSFVGEGAVGTSDAEGPIYSKYFEIAVGASLVVPIPEGAASFRLAGLIPGSTATPFTDDFTLIVRRGSDEIQNAKGLGAAIGDPSLFTQYMSGRWIPLVGSASSVLLDNSLGAGDAAIGYLQFKLDL